MIASKDVVDNNLDLNNIAKQTLPATKPSADALARLPIPPGTTWDKIKVSMAYDEELCNISVNNDSHSYRYDHPEFNGVFVHKRDSKPNKQWKLLMTFAKENGRIDWKKVGQAEQNTLADGNPDASDIADDSGETAQGQTNINKFKTHVELLRKTLQGIFGITANPISYSKADNAYRTYFEISYSGDDIPTRT